MLKMFNIDIMTYIPEKSDVVHLVIYLFLLIWIEIVQT